MASQATPSTSFHSPNDTHHESSPQWFGPVFGSQGQVTFRLWAPNAQKVDVVLYPHSEGRHQDFEMVSIPQERAPHGTQGWWTYTTAKAQPGDLYAFRLDGLLEVPDPASRFQPEDVHGPSLLKPFPNTPRLVEQKWTGLPWHQAVVYEIHVGTFTPEGTFRAIIEKLDGLKALGINTVSLMPIADFPGRFNWGYDGALLYAPDSQYGTPEDLIALIDACHEREMQILLDVVYNHFGPEGNYLSVYAKAFFNPNRKTPWGDAINFDGKSSPVVRDFFIQNALFWLNTYGFDGIRVDAVHAIQDSSPRPFVHALIDAIQKGPGQSRHIHVVLENHDNDAPYLEASLGQVQVSQWSDDFHHAAHVLVTRETQGYYEDYALPHGPTDTLTLLGRTLAEGNGFQGERSYHLGGRQRGTPSRHLAPTHFVHCIQTHDQVGNRAFGERIHTLSKSPKALQALRAIYLLSPSIPMLFMGEEWEASPPFYFFCDLSSDLTASITEGRRQECLQFSPAVSAETFASQWQPPCEEAAFTRSKLNWDERAISAHQGVLQEYQHLLHLRSRHIVPLLPHMAGMGGQSLPIPQQAPQGLWIRWAIPTQRASLTLLTNLSPQPLPLKNTPLLDGTCLQWIYSSESPLMDSWPALAQQCELPPWSVFWFLLAEMESSPHDPT